ncbi:MAG: GNAT family N-acetyltransferase [Clostridium sp.]|jgi:acetyltransferase|uniref:GNAT family N-acetyltransferase n=1 Tax=Clostridium sp. TaxID=1506 RepID=UPI0025D58E0B|nr:GNAT family N-acetyltransferase [Clostridium sp.]MDY6227716.1 GNAT family N-acetyltransferase [Clostridium sp.]
MILRKTNKKDINSVMKIINEAKDKLKRNGIDQWQNGYPNEEVILRDIEKNESYVLVYDEEIIGTTALSFNREITYDKIYEGKWISNGPYAVIHRIAVSKVKGINNIGTEILKKTEEICLSRGIKNIKIDTHEDNKAMQGLLKKNNFNYCGIIYLVDGSKRIAFEKKF